MAIKFNAVTVSFGKKVRILVSDIAVTPPLDPQKISVSSVKVERCKAIWDTGASQTVVTKKMISQLKLQPTGMTQVSNTSGVMNVNTYMVNLLLPNNMMVTFLPVTECEDILGDSDMLVGMDVIGAGDFAVTNVNNRTVMSYRFPSIEVVDYAKEANDTNSKAAAVVAKAKLRKEKAERNHLKKKSRKAKKKKR